MSFFLLFYFEYFLLLSSSLLIFPSTTSVINHSQCIFQLRHFSLLLCLGWALCVFSLSLLNIFIFLNIGSSCYHNTFLSLSADSAIYRIFLFAFLIIFNCMAIKIFFFLYFNEYSWVLFWEAIKVLGSNVILSDIAFKLCSVESEKVVQDKFCLSAKTKAF